MKRVLIIDDNEELGNIMEEYLRDKYKVKYMSSGKKGLEILFKEEFDYLLLDLVMPDCEGVEILNSVRKLLKAPKVIVISGHPKWANMTIALGAEKFLSKPFTMEDLLSSLD